MAEKHCIIASNFKKQSAHYFCLYIYILYCVCFKHGRLKQKLKN